MRGVRKIRITLPDHLQPQRSDPQEPMASKMREWAGHPDRYCEALTCRSTLQWPCMTGTTIAGIQIGSNVRAREPGDVPSDADLDAWGLQGIERTVARMKRREWFADVVIEGEVVRQGITEAPDTPAEAERKAVYRGGRLD